MYPREQIRAIAQKTDLVSLVGQHVLLKKRGKTYSGLCPFHNEKTPSFHVDPLKGSRFLSLFWLWGTRRCN